MAITEVKPSANKNPKRNRNRSLGPKKDLKKKKTKKSKAPTFDKTIEKKEKKKKKTKKSKEPTFDETIEDDDVVLFSEPVSASEQLTYFFNLLESAISIRVSSLELDSIKDTCVVELPQRLPQDVSNLGEHIKLSCGSSWKESLCEGETVEGSIDPGNPSVLVISSSALRSLELLRGLNSLTKQCPAVKLFSKHLKVEEQRTLGCDDKNTRSLRLIALQIKMYLHVFGSDDKIYQYVIGTCNAEQTYLHDLGSDDKIYQYVIGTCNAEQIYLHVTLLKKRVNIGSGTPSRIKKLIDIEALGLSRLDMIVLDMHTDVKGFSLFTLPQVRDEFWDLYKNCFHQRVLEGRLRICMYGPKPAPNLKKKKK